MIFKKGDPCQLANWRPTVLAADYKILAKALTNRLSSVMGVLVHPDQTGSVPGRSTRLNLVVLRWAEQRCLPLGLLGLDQQKAFDRVSHEYLARVLAQMGIGPVFRAWVTRLYCRAQSQIKVNGFLSRPVLQKGGCDRDAPCLPCCTSCTLKPWWRA